MKNLILLGLGFVLMVGLYSCQCDGCKYYDHRCEIKMHGFADSLLTTVTIKRYAKNTGFLSVEDSTIYNHIDSLFVTDPSSNTFVYGGRVLAFTADDVSDYGIVLANREELQLNNLEFAVEECTTCAKKFHIHKLRYCEVNGNVIQGETIDLYR
jgi:hypothetical protein